MNPQGKLYIHFLLVVLIGVSLSSCEPRSLEDPPDWSPEVYGPMLKSVSSVEDITKLENIEFSQDVVSTDVDQNWTGTKDVPPTFQTDTVGPYPFPLTEEGYIGSVDVDSLKLRIYFENQYNLNIEEGTKLLFLSAIDGSLIHEHTLQKDVAPNEMFDRTFTVTNTRVASEINFYLVDFQTDGGQNIDFSSPNNVTTFNFELQFLKINSAQIRKDKEYTIEDTSEVNFREEREDSDVSDDAAEGYLYLYVENGFPIESNLDVFFINEFGQIEHELFDTTQTVKPADVVPETGKIQRITERKISIRIDEDVVENIEDANRVVSSIQLNTYGVPADSENNIKLLPESSLLLQLVADLEVKTKGLPED